MISYEAVVAATMELARLKRDPGALVTDYEWARTILEAAAPYIAAEAWDEGSQARWDYQWRDDIDPLTNPYRSRA